MTRIYYIKIFLIENTSFDFRIHSVSKLLPVYLLSVFYLSFIESLSNLQQMIQFRAACTCMDVRQFTRECVGSQDKPPWGKLTLPFPSAHRGGNPWVPPLAVVIYWLARSITRHMHAVLLLRSSWVLLFCYVQ